MLEIGLVIIGLIIIVTSYIISGKTENNQNNKQNDEFMELKSLWTEKEEKKVRERIDSLVEERVGLAIDQTEDELSRISNEKIITSNEFSEQVLEKIEQNHEEVVFLYNMLNEKEKQMKDLMKEIDTLKTGTQKTIQEYNEKEEEFVSFATMNHLKTVNNLDRELEELKELNPQVNLNNITNINKENSQLAGIMSVIEEEKKDVDKEEMETGSNRNKEILSLYKQGKSVLEISKVLDMGQGEVKLVIDLFQGVKA